MPLETGTYIQDLVNSNPPDADSVSQGAAHLRLIKQVIENTFPNATKLFRFPAGVAKATGTVTVNFPGDHNKLFPVNAAGGAITVNLPDPTSGGTVNEDGFTLTVVKQDNTNNAVTIAPAGAQTLNGASGLTLVKQNQYVILIWNKADATWYFSKIGLTGATQNPAPQAKSANYTVALADDGVTFEVTGLPWTLTIPSTGLYAGFKVKAQILGVTSTNALTIAVSGAAVIYGNFAQANGGGNTVTSFRMFGFGDTVELEFDGTNWLARLTMQDAESIGTVKMWMTEFVPSPKWVFLHTNGGAISRTTYAELFTLWSTHFGTGDGSTTFGLPSMAGQFIRGWNNAQGIDPDAASRTDRGDGTTGDHVGTKQADQVGPHTHDVKIPWTNTPTQVASVTATVSVIGDGLGQNATVHASSGNGALTNGTTETRAKNISVGFVVKALP